MNFNIRHTNINVRDLDISKTFYQSALGLKITREKVAEDGSFKLLYLSDQAGQYEIELTWLKSHQDQPYQLGENEWHICFGVDDYEAAHALHEKMGCIVYENKKMGLYFIADPDGYWIEITPTHMWHQ